jgi:hypothetical protein
MSYKFVLAAAIATALSGAADAQQPSATTTDIATARAEVPTAIPSNATTVTNYYKQNVYDPSESKIGEIVDVLVTTGEPLMPSSSQSAVFSASTRRMSPFRSPPSMPPRRTASGG